MAIGSGFDGVAACYGASRLPYPRALLDWLAETRPALPEGPVVDLGCGPGVLTHPLAQHFPRVIGVDLSWGMLRVLTRSREGGGGALHAVQARGETLPLATSSVSLLCSSQSLHWMDRERVAEEAGRILRPGGAWLVCWQDWMAKDSAQEEIYLEGWRERVGEPPARPSDRPPMSAVAKDLSWPVGARFDGDVSVSWSPEELACFFESRQSVAQLSAPQRLSLRGFWVRRARERMGEEVPYTFQVGARLLRPSERQE